MTVLEVSDLAVEFASARGPVAAVRGASLQVGERQIVGLVGESGSGKSATALAVLRLLHPRARITGGRILFAGRDLARASEKEMLAVRGAQVSLVPQDPLTALNPGARIASQLATLIRRHRGLSRREARAAAVEALAQVRLPQPEAMLHRYAHELSGGQRQRVVIALALVGGPRLLIADEATTALDVTTQSQVLTLLRERAAATGMSVLLITHDLGVVAQYCQRVAVMHDGMIVEQGAVADVFVQPEHEYTGRLLAAAGSTRRAGAAA
jgi:ABC-type dipeptide/oligopeptide/nickel transport system ATPase component